MKAMPIIEQLRAQEDQVMDSAINIACQIKEPGSLWEARKRIMQSLERATKAKDLPGSLDGAIALVGWWAVYEGFERRLRENESQEGSESRGGE